MIACQLRSLWYESDPSAADGIAWHGEEAWRMHDLRSMMGLDYKIVTGNDSEHTLLFFLPLAKMTNLLLHYHA